MPKKEFTCPNCNKKFERFYSISDAPSGQNKYIARYCSRPCRSAFQKTTLNETQKKALVALTNEPKTIQQIYKETGVYYKSVWYALEKGKRLGIAECFDNGWRLCTK